jgi:transposase-like protein
MEWLDENFNKWRTRSKKYRFQLQSTNSQKQEKEEIQRLERVILFFSIAESAICHIGALLADYHKS